MRKKQIPINEYLFKENMMSCTKAHEGNLIFIYSLIDILDIQTRIYFKQKKSFKNFLLHTLNNYETNDKWNLLQNHS